ncbi:MAG: hypothetical protein ACYC7D_07345 [Nitrososphaerales archaeon]
MQSFESLISNARKWRMNGWDFSSLGERFLEEEPPWDYGQTGAELLKGINSVLDLGTGVGEFPSSLEELPSNTLCTEGFYVLKDSGMSILHRRN